LAVVFLAKPVLVVTAFHELLELMMKPTQLPLSPTDSSHGTHVWSKERSMDREKLEESFSSPSVRITVTSISGYSPEENPRYQRRGFSASGEGPACRVRLSDGSSYLISPGALIELGLAKDKELSPEDMSLLITASRHRRILNKAMELMNRRDHSYRELLTKLEQKYLYPKKTPKYTPPPLSPADKEEIRSLCYDVADQLERQGVVDDKRYAENWVAIRLKRHPEGMGALQSGLASKGVDRKIVAEVLEPYREGDIPNDALERAGEKLLKRSKMNGAKLLRSLMTKGFSYPEVRNWMEEKGVDLRTEREEW